MHHTDTQGITKTQETNTNMITIIVTGNIHLFGLSPCKFVPYFFTPSTKF